MSERKQRIEEWLASSRSFLFQAAGALNEAGWQRLSHRDGSGWTARDVLAHIAGAEPSMYYIIAEAQAQGSHTPRPGFDLNYWNRRQVEKRASKSPQDLLTELENSRAATRKLLAEMSESTLDLRVRHPAYGDMIVEDVFRTIGFHERLHAEELLSAAGTASSSGPATA